MQQLIFSILRSLLAVVSTDRTRLTMQNIHVESNPDGSQTWVSTDGAKMIRYTLEAMNVSGPELPEGGVNIPPSLCPTRGKKYEKVVFEFHPAKTSGIFEIHSCVIDQYHASTNPKVIGYGDPEKYVDWRSVWENQIEEMGYAKPEEFRLSKGNLDVIAKIGGYVGSTGKETPIHFKLGKKDSAMFIQFGGINPDLVMMCMPVRID